MKKITKELLDKSVKQLKKEAGELRVEIARSILSAHVTKPKDTNAITKKRKRLAVTLTVVRQKKDSEVLKKKS